MPIEPYVFPEFGFAPWWKALLSLLPALINIFLFLYAGFKLPRSKTNLVFVQFLVFLTLWQIAESCARTSETIEAATFFNRIAVFPILAVPVLGTKFVLRLWGKHKLLNSRWFFIFYFIIPLAFALLLTGSGCSYTITPSTVFNWEVNPQSNPITTTYLFWLGATSLIMLSCSWLAYFQTPTNHPTSKRLLLLALGFTAPVILGVAFEIILPLLFSVNAIPVTNISVLAFTFAAAYAISQNNLLKAIPKNEWKYILNNMDEGIVIIDDTKKIRFASKSAQSIFEMSSSDYASFQLLKSLEDAGITIHRAQEYSADLGYHQVYLPTAKGNSKHVKVQLKTFQNEELNRPEILLLVSDLNALRSAESLALQNSRDLGDFLYRTSHDLKNPSVCIEGLLSIYEDATAEEKQKCIDLIGVSNQKIKAILNGISAITKVTQHEVKYSSFNLRELVVQRAALITPRDTIMRLNINIEEDTTLFTDKALMSAIVDEIILNASKYRRSPFKNSFLNICLTKNWNK